MRLSVNKDDPGYNLELGIRATVFVDGKELVNCFTADEEEGIAYCHVVDENYETIIENGQLKVREIKGNVEIIIDEKIN